MSMFGNRQSEIQLIGDIKNESKAAVIGKIRFFDESYTEGSILCVKSDQYIDREALLLCPPLAVIFFYGKNTAYSKELISIGVPCLILTDCDRYYELCKNKIALLDTKRGTLTLDPSIETIELYSSSSKKASTIAFECDAGKIIKSTNIEELSYKKSEHYLASASIFNKKELFDASIELWEHFCPELLIIDLAVPSGLDGDERIFAEQIESLYRAALYGSLAISLSSFNTEDELSHAMRILQKAFCMLEAEGREFNAYLPRGITFSSPIHLMRPSPLTNPDFLIFDLDNLLPALFSLSSEEIIKKEKALKKELLSVFERYISTLAPKCDIYLKAENFFNTTLLHELSRLAEVKVIFY